MQAMMTALRETSEGSRGPERGSVISPEALGDVGPPPQRATEGWRTWHADLREAVRQPSFGSRVEKGRRGAGIPAVSQGFSGPPPPLVAWTSAGEEAERAEGPYGYGRETAPGFLSLTWVGADTGFDCQGPPYPMETATWEEYEGRGEPCGSQRIADWRHGGSSSSGLGAIAEQEIEANSLPAGMAPASSTQYLADRALLRETRRQAVRFLD